MSVPRSANSPRTLFPILLVSGGHPSVQRIFNPTALLPYVDHFPSRSLRLRFISHMITLLLAAYPV